MRSLIKGVLKTGSGAVGNLLIGIASIKIMAVILGPTGTGLFSLIRQSVTTLTSLGAGGQTALVQGVARKAGAERDSYVRSVFWLFILIACVSLALIESFAPVIAMLVFGKSDAVHISLIRWIALPVLLMHAYVFLRGVLNGHRAIGRLALIEMAGPLITLVLVYPVCVSVGEGYALAFIWMLSASQVVMIASSFLILHKQSWVPTLFVDSKIIIQPTDFRYFLTIAGTITLTGLIGAGTLLAVRTMIVRSDGLTEAGLFDLAWSLSGGYVALILSSFGTYYAPTLSQAVDKIERTTLISRVIRLSTLLMTPLIVTVVVLKPMLVSLLYSREYMASLEMVRWMLIGDYLKITSWVLAIPAIVNTDMKIYFWTEAFWYIVFLVLSAVAILYFRDLQGVGIAFTVLYFILVVYYLQYVRRVYELSLTSDLLIPWFVGFAIVIIVSIQNWNRVTVDWVSSLLWIIGSMVFVIIFLNKFERKMVWGKFCLWLRIN